MPALFAKAIRSRFLPVSPLVPSLLLIPLLLIPLLLMPGIAEAQLIRVQQPLQSASDTFFNRTGVNFGLSFAGNGRIMGLNAAGQLTPNINVTQNSVGATVPPFGRYDPGADLNAGVAVIGGDAGFSLGLVAGKGSSRSLVSTTPSVTMFNGQSASIFDGTVSPFVTGIVPVLGNSSGTQMVRSWGLPQGMRVSGTPDRPVNTSPQSYSDPSSTATRGTLGLAEIERMRANAELQHQTELNAEIQELVARARQLVEEEKFGAARVKYSRALRQLDRSDAATAELHDVLTAELNAIRQRR